MSLEAIIGLQSNILSKLRVLITLRGFVSSFLSIVKTDSIKVKKAHFYLLLSSLITKIILYNIIQIFNTYSYF